MPSRRLYLPLALLAAASLAGDVFCRTLAGSANQEQMLQSAAQCVTRLPDTIGPWRSERGEPLSDTVLALLQCRAHETRVYTHDQTGEQVAMILMVGAAGPLVAHTAEVCYGSAAWDIIEPPGSVTIRSTGDSTDVFHQVTFRSTSLSGQNLRVYYAWRKFDGRWLAPNDPRLALGGQPLLYKLQLSSDVPPAADKSPDSNPTRRFLTDLLPVLDKILAPK